jgi:hypothetical protein
MANAKRRCIFCKEYEYAEDGIVLNPGFFCSIEHATKYGHDKAVKTKEKAVKDKNKKFKAKVLLKDVAYQHSITQPVYNRMRVLEEKLWYLERGLTPKCISCGKKEDFCCGHFKTRGSQKNLAYDRVNNFLQCNTYCNKHLSGNINGNKNTRGYIAGLFERFGDEKAQEIIDYCEAHTEVKKWTGEELIGMRAEFNAKIRQLKQRLDAYS